jgi:vitamin B12 transporter
METSQTYSLTVVSDVYDSPRVSLRAFQTDLRDAIIYARGPAAAGQFVNVPQALVRGLELEGDWKPVDEFAFTYSYTYQEAIDLHHHHWLPATPRHSARVTLDYQPIHDLKISLDSQYLGPQYTRRDNSTSIPDLYLTNLRAQYSRDDLTLYTALDNLFNRRYQSSYGYLAPPLTWTAGIKYEW